VQVTALLSLISLLFAQNPGDATWGNLDAIQDPQAAAGYREKCNIVSKCKGRLFTAPAGTEVQATQSHLRTSLALQVNKHEPIVSIVPVAKYSSSSNGILFPLDQAEHGGEAWRGLSRFACSSRARPSDAPAAAVRRTRRIPSTSRRAPRKISARHTSVIDEPLHYGAEHECNRVVCEAEIEKCSFEERTKSKHTSRSCMKLTV
jgi:hypothetical protein